MSRKKSSLPAGIKQRADGGYEVRVAPTHPLTGKRMDRMTTLPPGASLVQAVEAKERLLAEARGEAGPPEEMPRLSAYCESWLKQRTPRVRRKSAETYASRIAHHLIPYLGKVRLDALERRHLIWWRDELQSRIQADDLSLATVRSAWTVGLIVLRDALAEYGLTDITQRLEPPVGDQARRRPPLALSREEVAELLDACTGRYASAVRFLARTGVRAGEMRGLRWMDLDLEGGIAHIRQSIAWVDSERSFQATPPKGKKARFVPLTPDLSAALLEHRSKNPGVGEALVWSTEDGAPLRPLAIYRTLDSATQRLGWEARVVPQNLRQTVNSLALASGVEGVVLRSMIGHNSEAMTEHYHQLRPEVARAAAGQMWDPGVGPRDKTEESPESRSRQGGEGVMRRRAKDQRTFNSSVDGSNPS